MACRCEKKKLFVSRSRSLGIICENDRLRLAKNGAMHLRPAKINTQMKTNTIDEDNTFLRRFD